MQKNKMYTCFGAGAVLTAKTTLSERKILLISG